MKRFTDRHWLTTVGLGAVAAILVFDLLASRGHLDALGIWAPGKYPEKMNAVAILLSLSVFSIFLLSILMRALRKQSGFEKLMDHIPSGVAILKPTRRGDDFRMFQFNQPFLQLFGVDTDRVDRTLLSETIPGLLENGVFRAIRQVYRSGEPEKLHALMLPGETSKRWVNLEIFKSPSNFIILICSDVSEDQIRKVIMDRTEEIAKIGSWLYDLRTNEITWSKQTHDIFETDPPPYPGTEILFAEEEREGFRKLVDRAIEKGTPYEGMFHAPLRDGREKLVYVQGFAQTDLSGKVILLYGSVQDITRQKKLEAEREELLKQAQRGQRLEALGQFSGGFAHELNNILQDLLLHVESASDRCDAKEVQDSLQAIQKGCRNASELCEQILVYAGKREAKNRCIAPADLIPQWIIELREVLPEGFLVLSEFHDRDTCIWADPVQIRQLIFKCVQNAAEAYSKEGGTIFLKTRCVDLGEDTIRQCISPPPAGPGTYFQLEISDRGEGIGPDVLDKIFEPFFSTRFHGRGLGLSTVLGTVRSLKGGIHVASSKKQGTIVQIFIPIYSQCAISDKPTEPAPATSRGDTILIIDDEAGIREGLAAVLKTKGYQVLTAENGQSGLDHFNAHRKQILAILLDLTMPVLDGGQTLKAIRQLDKTTPVIIISGYDAGDATFDVPEDQVSAFLHKPFSIQPLLKTLDDVTKK